MNKGLFTRVEKAMIPVLVAGIFLMQCSSVPALELFFEEDPLDKGTNWYAYINDSLIPEYGLADMEDKELYYNTPQRADVSGLQEGCGIVGADIVDMTDDGKEDLVLYHTAYTWGNGGDYYGLVASLYTENGGTYNHEGDLWITDFGDVMGSGVSGIGYEHFQVGIVELDGSHYIWSEGNVNAYHADYTGFRVNLCGWIDNQFRMMFINGKTDGGSSGIAYSLKILNSDGTDEKIVEWADEEYWYYENDPSVIDASFNECENGADAIVEGYRELGFSDDPDISLYEQSYWDLGYGEEYFPTYWTSDIVKRSVEFGTVGDRGNVLQFSINDYTGLLEKLNQTTTITMPEKIYGFTGELCEVRAVVNTSEDAATVATWPWTFENVIGTKDNPIPEIKPGDVSITETADHEYVVSKSIDCPSECAFSVCLTAGDGEHAETSVRIGPAGVENLVLDKHIEAIHAEWNASPQENVDSYLITCINTGTTGEIVYEDEFINTTDRLPAGAAYSEYPFSETYRTREVLYEAIPELNNGETYCVYLKTTKKLVDGSVVYGREVSGEITLDLLSENDFWGFSNPINVKIEPSDFLGYIPSGSNTIAEEFADRDEYNGYDGICYGMCKAGYKFYHDPNMNYLSHTNLSEYNNYSELPEELQEYLKSAHASQIRFNQKTYEGYIPPENATSYDSGRDGIFRDSVKYIEGKGDPVILDIRKKSVLNRLSDMSPFSDDHITSHSVMVLDIDSVDYDQAADIFGDTLDDIKKHPIIRLRIYDPGRGNSSANYMYMCGNKFYYDSHTLIGKFTGLLDEKNKDYGEPVRIHFYNITELDNNSIQKAN